MRNIVTRLRQTSIKRRLTYLLLLQFIIIMLLFSLATYSSVTTMTRQVHMSGQQLLHTAASKMDDARAEIVGLTRYPVIADAYGSTHIFHYLLEMPIGEHQRTEHMLLQYELVSQIRLHPYISMLGIADLGGGFLYCDEDNSYYQLATCNRDSTLYRQIMDGRGACRIISSAEIAELFPRMELAADCLYGARAIMTFNPLEAVGIVVCRVGIDDIRLAFEMNRLYDEQSLRLWSESGQLLYGEALDFPGTPAAKGSVQGSNAQGVITQWRNGEAGFGTYQFFYAAGGGKALLYTPLRCYLRSLETLLAALLMVLPFLVISFLMLSHILVRSIRDPIDKLMGMCVRVQARDFSPLEDEGASDEMHSLIDSFNVMCSSNRNLIEVVYEKNLLQAQTEMQLVRSQINSHFVYNTLEVIRAASHSRGQTDISDMTALLGKTLRYGINRRSDSVTVEQEVFYLRDYIALQQMHLQNRLEVYMNVDRSLYPRYMLRLVLQPLVENAIHHGMPQDGSPGVLRILGFVEQENIVFTVSDDGVGISPERLTLLQDYIEGKNDDFASIGLKNTHRRLMLHYGEDYGMSIRSIPNQGTVVTVRMPLRTVPFAEES